MTGTLQAILRQRATDDTTAVKFDGNTWTWREHLERASAHAAALLAIADRTRPMHVGTLLGNTPSMLEQMAAAALGGYTLVGINDTRRGSAIVADVQRADCQILLVDAAHQPLVADLDLGDIQVIDPGSEAWHESASAAGELIPYRTSTADDTFMLLFTSGTSGNPKAVKVPHSTVLISGQALAERFAISIGDTCYLSMPLFHSNAVYVGWGVAVCSGAAMAPATFSASGFLRDVRRYDATYMNYVGKPLSYILATQANDDDTDNPLRVAFGNEATDRDIELFSERFGVTVWDGFGATENAVIITREAGTPRGSIGKGWPGIAIYDSETITECAPARFDADGNLVNSHEAIGEIVNTAGLGMFAGYYNDEQSTAARTRHGMFWSGDLGYRDPAGWIYLAGRTGEWLRVDGENVATAPIERIIMRHVDICVVAVYAVPDSHVGDQIMAAVVPVADARLTPADFEEFLAAQRDLSPKAWPRYVRIASELPSTATHKILKRQLSEQGATADQGELWQRDLRRTQYHVVERGAPRGSHDVLVREA